MTKLTKAQAEVLASIKWGGRYHIATKAASKALIRKGLAKENEFGVLAITSAGRAAIEKDTAHD